MAFDLIKRIVATLMLFAIASPSAHGQAASAATSSQEWLRSAVHSIDWVNHYSSITNVRYRASMGEGPARMWVGTDAKVTKYRDGDRLHIIIDFIDHLSRAGEVIRRASRRETVFGPEGRTGWWFPADNPLSGSAQVAKDAARTSKMRLVDECDSNTGAFLDGCVDGLGNVLDLAGAGTLSPDIQHEQIDGVDCSIVASRSKSTLIKLWIAPSKGNLVVKYLLEQSEGAAGPTRAVFQASSYQNIGNRTIVRAGRSTRSWVDQNDQTKWSETVDAERVDLNLEPDFNQSGLFSTRDVPNGIRVFIDELPNVGVDFIWSNGRPIAKVDTDLFSELDNSVQQTIAGKVSMEAPITPVLETESRNGDGSEQRTTQVWTALIGSAGFAALLLIWLCIKRRNVRAAR
jgi:hypothetical protein